MATYVKLTIKMPNEVHDELEGLARQRGTNVTGLIKRAVALDKYVWLGGALQVRLGAP